MAPLADQDEIPVTRSRRRAGCGILLAALAVLVLAGLAIAWLNRESLAEDYIADTLERSGVAATYEIERIGGRRQILRNIVIGDPARPDMTVERAEVTLRHRFGFPAIARIRLVRPRLFGTYIDGKLSFGALDPLIFTDKDGPFEFPNFELAVVDGRGLIEGDLGPVGLKLDGAGHLRGGFAAELAAVAPRFAVPGCDPVNASLYGRVAIDAERPEFQGPVRVNGLACPDHDLAVRSAVFQVDARADRTLTAFDGTAGIDARTLAFAGGRAQALAGDTRVTWRDGGLTARYELAAVSVETPQAAAARLSLDGSLRTRRNFARIELDSEIDGTGVRLGNALDRTLADAGDAAGDTLLGPILERMRTQLAREGRTSRLAAELALRRTGGRTSVVVPNATLRGTSGATLLSLSRFQLALGGAAAPRLSGNFATGGDGLPRIVGRFEQSGGGTVQGRLAMAEYSAGSSRLAIPELALVQRGDGTLGFAGRVRASGALPGGEAEALLMPVSGNWSRAGGLALWDDCTELQFERLRLANLTLARQRLTLCPPPGTAIVRADARGLRVAAGAPSLQLAGRLGETPIQLRSGPVGFAWPGAIAAERLVVTLGPAGTASTFAINDLTAQVGEDIAGRFDGTDVRLFAVPLDLLGASGDWRYSQGRLVLTNGAFRLVDRQDPARFNPLTAQGASLTLEDNLIAAEALLREPTTGRTVTEADLVHSLASGRGHVDLAVPGLQFDSQLQPGALFPAAYGLVAGVRGVVTGTGRIEWTEQGITSTGRFSSESLDFAAAFGPVRGASGTIEFTDLLGLTTAPNQRLRVASINPGIEVTDGEILIELRGGSMLALGGGTWPFMGGTLTLRPVDITFGASEVRRYVLEIEGLDAARFIERMELNNISATGIFDGTVPLVFDESGNGRIEGGLLLSRPPGGNMSYVGELTYENLGAIANFAFSTLRSLDYRQMRIAMDGSLTGNIVTRVRLDGVSQGAGTKQNIITRTIAGLPIRLDINVTAPFYSLLSNIRSMYDPAAIRDPRDLGLIDAEGNALRREARDVPPEPVSPADLIPDEAVIQRRESEEMP